MFDSRRESTCIYYVRGTLVVLEDHGRTLFWEAEMSEEVAKGEYFAKSCKQGPCLKMYC